jgi:hypothetical protein
MVVHCSTTKIAPIVCYPSSTCGYDSYDTITHHYEGISVLPTYVTIVYISITSSYHNSALPFPMHYEHFSLQL